MKIQFKDEFEVSKWADENGGPTAVVIALKTDKFADDETTLIALDEYFLNVDGPAERLQRKIDELERKQEQSKYEYAVRAAAIKGEQESINSEISLMTAKWTRLAGLAAFLGIVVALAGPAESLSFLKSIWAGIKGLFSKS